MAVAVPHLTFATTDKPSVLVLGGTKFLGRATVEAALARGYKVSLFHRGKTHPELFPEAEHLIGDRNDNLKELEGRTFDWIIDTSGQRPNQVRTSTALLNKAKRYVYVSSISAYADKSILGMTEDAPLVVPQADEILEKEEQITYSDRKVRCEQLTRDAFGARATIVRPCLVVGPHDHTDRFTYWPMRFAAGGRILAPGKADDPIQWIDVRDLAHWMLDLCVQDKGGTFNAVGPAGRGTIGQLMQACREASGVESQVVWVCAEDLEKFQISAWGDMPAWIPPDSKQAGFTQIDNRRALAAGLKPRPLIDTVRDTLAWKLASKEPMTAGIKREREAEVLGL